MTTNTGYFDEGIPTVRQYVRAFGDYDYIVAPSVLCRRRP
ncbi:L-lactate dehydrogenase [Cutibacterium acnes JCM 18918]|nr:L-lactate dehydrogenase [Cutibacterium acnes JCM 18918]